MKVRFQSAWLKIKNRWDELEKSQQVKLVVATVVLVATLIFALYMVMKPNQYLILDKADFGVVTDAQSVLADAGIESTLTSDSRGLYVKDTDANSAKLILGTSNVTNVTGFTFTDALDMTSIGTTESVRSEALKQAKQTEIARTLEAFDGVQSAKVLLNEPKDDDFFLENKSEATAGVQLTLSKQIDKIQAESIARFVSVSVVGLDMKNIEVIDQYANVLYSGATTTGSSVGTEYDMELQRKTEIENKVRNLLQPLYQEIKITSNLKLEWDKTQVATETYTSPITDSATGLVASEHKEQSSVVDTSTSGEPGIGSNDETVSDYMVEGNSSSTADSKVTDSEYYVNKEVVQSEHAAGTVNYDDSSIAVVLYNYKYYDEQYLTANDQLNGLTWTDYKNSITNQIIPVDQEIIDSIKIGTGIPNVNVIGYEVPMFIDQVKEPIKTQEIIMFVVLTILIVLLAYLIIKNTQIEEIEETEPELSVEDLLVSTQLEEEIEREQLAEIKYNEENEVKLQIEKFVTEKPEAVAQLLRNWLNDEWE